MKVQELIASCDASIKQWEITNYEWCNYPPIPLVLSGYPTGNKMRLSGRSGPYCEWIANSMEGRGTVCYFDARKVKKYLEKLK